MLAADKAAANAKAAIAKAGSAKAKAAARFAARIAVSVAHATHAADAAAKAAVAGDTSIAVAAAKFAAAAYAAHAAAHAAADADDDREDNVEATNAAAIATNEMLRTCRHDYQLLLELSGQAGGELGTPIDLATLGPLWPEGELRWERTVQVPSATATWGVGTPKVVVTPADNATSEVGPPSLIIAWDPEILSEDDYARLVTALGDVVRAEGGTGIKRLQSRGFGVPVDAGVLQ
jgi:hypothetical protein